MPTINTTNRESNSAARPSELPEFGVRKQETCASGLCSNEQTIEVKAKLAASAPVKEDACACSSGCCDDKLAAPAPVIEEDACACSPTGCCDAQPTTEAPPSSLHTVSSKAVTSEIGKSHNHIISIPDSSEPESDQNGGGARASASTGTQQGSQTQMTDLRLTKFRVMGLCCHKEMDLIKDLLDKHKRPGIVSVEGHILSRTISVKYDCSQIATEKILDVLNAFHLGASVQEAIAGEDGDQGGNQIPFDGAGLRAVLAYAFLVVLSTIFLFTDREAIVSLSISQIISLLVLFVAGGSVVIPAVRSIQQKKVDIFVVLMSVALAGAMISGAVEDAAELVAMYHVGKFITSEVMGRVNNQMNAVMNIKGDQPSTCLDGRGKVTLVSALRAGDEVLSRPGDCIPVDGVVVEGRGSVDEASLTGESLTIEKARNDQVYGGTICQNGFMKIRCTAALKDSLCSSLMDTSAALREDKLTATQRFVDRFAAVFTPLVLLSAAATGLAGMFVLHWQWQVAVQRASFLLVLGCPCALLLAVPLPSALFVAYAASIGVVVNSGSVMENLCKVTSVIFDKTGTLTDGLFKVSPSVFFASSSAIGGGGSVMPMPPTTEGASTASAAGAHKSRKGNALLAVEGATQDDVMKIVASLEAQSTHPIAVAVMQQQMECLADAVNAAKADGGVDDEGGVAGMLPVKKFKVLEGNKGCRGVVRWCKQYEIDVVVGAADAVLPALNKDSLDAGATKERLNAWQQAHKGHVQVLSSFDGDLVCALALFDNIRPTSRSTVQQLKCQPLSLKVGILSGDKPDIVRSVGSQLGLAVAADNKRANDDVVVAGGMTPSMKREFITRAQNENGEKVLMTGDGVNDVPALSAATVSLAVGPGGSTLAGEAADAVLNTDDLDAVPAVLRLARHAMRTVYLNILIALLSKGLAALYVVAVWHSFALWIAVLADLISLLAVVLCTVVSMSACRDDHGPHFLRP